MNEKNDVTILSLDILYRDMFKDRNRSNSLMKGNGVCFLVNIHDIILCL